jgi:putative NADH-flavin reductase
MQTRSTLHVTVLGAAGRTGRLVVDELLRRGHAVRAVARDPHAAGLPAQAEVVAGDVRDREVLARAVAGADAVVSALGPRGKDADLHRTLARLLVPVLREAGVERYVAVSGAGVDVEGDRKRPRDKVISKLMQTLGGAMVADKAGEVALWRASGLRWTLVRPPRLTDGPATGRLEHDAHVSTRAIFVDRVDLAAFLADVVEQDLYAGRAPFVATAR